MATRTVELLINTRLDGQAIQEIGRRLEGLKVDIKALNNAAAELGNTEFLAGDEILIEGSIQDVRRLAEEYRKLAISRTALGQIKDATIALGRSNQLNATADSLENLTKGIENQTKSLGDYIVGWKRLGFEIFLIQNTISTFVSLATGLFETLEEGARALDRFTSFEKLTAFEGIVPEDLDARLKGVAQGLVGVEDAYSGVLKLIGAGQPAIADNADVLLSIAVNSAKVQGDLSKTTQIYTKLIEGIIKGSPRLIDDALVVLKLGSAYEEFAASLNKSSDDLTENEKILATFFATAERAPDFEALAGEIKLTQEGYQRIRIELEELGKTWKAFLSEFIMGGVNGLEILLKLNAGISGTSTGLSSLRDIVANTFGDFLGGLETAGVLLSDTLGDALVKVIENIREFASIWSDLFVALNSADVPAITAQLLKLQNASDLTDGVMGELVLTSEELENAMSAGRDRAAEFFNAFSSGADVVEETGDVLDKELEEMRRRAVQTALFLQDLQNTIDSLTGQNINVERADRQADAVESLSEKITSIRERLADRLVEIEENLTDRLADAIDTRADKLLDIEEDLAIKLERISEDLALKLQRIREDIEDKRKNRAKDHAKELEDIEEDHLRKLRKIQEKFELARTKALIDRDARALFEAQQQRDSAIRDLNEETGTNREEEIEDYEDFLNEIRELEKRRREEAIEAAERRREDAELAAKRAREEAEKRYKEEVEDAEKKAKKEREKERERAEESLRDEKKSLEKRLREIQDWYKERLFEQSKAAFAERLKQLQDQVEKEGLLEEHIEKRKRIWADYALFLSGLQLPTPIEGGGGTPGAPGDGNGTPVPPPPSPVQPTPAIVEGAPCNAPSGRGYVGEDGRTYLCVNGRWKPIENTGINPPGGMGTFPQVSTTSTNGPLTQRVVIQAKGDKTLEAIFKEMAYDAFIEVVS